MNPFDQFLTMGLMDTLNQALINDYKKLSEENAELKKAIMEMEVKMDLLEKAIIFLSARLDDTDLELGFTANAEYLVKKILQK